MQHSDAGRMHGQDAVLNPRVKDPSAKLTFPEFIRERVPPDSELLQDPSIKLSLPEFVAQNVPPEELAAKANGATGGKHKKNKSSSGSSSRNRSLSAPPLAWLRKNSSSGSSASSSSKNATKSQEQGRFNPFLDLYADVRPAYLPSSPYSVRYRLRRREPRELASCARLLHDHHWPTNHHSRPHSGDSAAIPRAHLNGR